MLTETWIHVISPGRFNSANDGLVPVVPYSHTAAWTYNFVSLASPVQAFL
jgi:hypothetical protein